MATSPYARTLERSERALHRVEDALLALLLGAMILLSSLQILLRDVFGGGLGWVDPMLRVMVLWLGLLGALAASRSGRQITVDVISRILPRRPRAAAGFVTSLFTATVSAVVAYHAGRFVISEYAFGSAAFTGIPAWQLACVVPFAFGLIALRYLVHAVSDLRAALSQRDAT